MTLWRNAGVYHLASCNRKGDGARPWAYARNKLLHEVVDETLGKPGLVQPAKCCIQRSLQTLTRPGLGDNLRPIKEKQT